jgi:DNA-binding Lrp family transcriptional regulator
MVTAIVLINVDHGRIQDVADALLRLDDVTEVYSVGGRFDLVAVIRTRTNEDMANLVTDHMLKISNIQTTETLIAFKAFSRYDLERMFSIGDEGV